MELKDQLDIVFKIVGITGGLLAAFKVVYELREARKQKARDLRWKQANAARELINELLDEELVLNAITMFDWSGREFEILPNETEAIEFEDVRVALRTTDLNFTDKEVFIRDCVDTFLFKVEMIEQSIENGLIEYKDVRFPMEYYFKTAHEHGILTALREFIKKYSYKNSEKFIQRLGY